MKQIHKELPITLANRLINMLHSSIQLTNYILFYRDERVHIINYTHLDINNQVKKQLNHELRNIVK